MRAKFSYVVITLVVLFVVTGGFLWQRFSYAKECLDIRTSQQIDNCLAIIPRLRIDLVSVNRLMHLPVLSEALEVIDEVEALLPHKDYLLGVGRPTSYIVLLLNDQELRTNGGFMGSYAVAKVDNYSAQVKFQDIYVPDGQLPGYVPPPQPIQDAFQTGSYRLPNADWSPDYPKSAVTIRWFFEKGGEVNPDVLATITLATVKEIMAVIGPVEVPEYQVTLSSENVYKWLQDNAEVDFFPGSTQKKDAISAVGNALIEKSRNLNWRKKIKIAKLLLNNLNQQNVLVNSLNKDVNEVFLAKNWGGEYAPLPCPKGEDCQMITTGVVEVNLGANKANCCVTRNTFHKISKSPDGLIHLIEVKLNNSSKSEETTKGVFYGGNYLSYFRFYLPANALNITVIAHPSVLPSLGTWPVPYDGEKGRLDIVDAYGFKEVGFFHLTRAQEDSLINVSYHLRDQGKNNLWLTVLKQHGVKKSPHEIELFGKSMSDNLEDDLVVEVD